jgi:hypothetical protein
VPSGVNTVIEYYFDQPTGNSLTGSQLLANDLDLLEISADYSNLNFEMNEFHNKLSSIALERRGAVKINSLNHRLSLCLKCLKKS